MPAQPWPRRLFVAGGAPAVVEFVVFAPSTFPLDFELSREGSPLAALGTGLSVQVYERSLAERFAEWADGLAEDPDAPLGLGVAAAWYVVGGEVEDEEDFSALQSAWAAVRVILRAGGLAVWESLAMRWTSAADALAANPELPALAGAWNVNLAEVDGGGFVAVHTLGLPKFARSDLLAFTPPAAVGALRTLLHHLALDLIEGAQLHAGDRIARGGMEIEVAAYLPGNNGPPVDIPFLRPPLVLLPPD